MRIFIDGVSPNLVPQLISQLRDAGIPAESGADIEPDIGIIIVRDSDASVAVQKLKQLGFNARLEWW